MRSVCGLFDSVEAKGIAAELALPSYPPYGYLLITAEDISRGDIDKLVGSP